MSSFSPKAVRFDDDAFWVDVADGRTIGVPLAWFPRLLFASPEQRALFELSPLGIHWDALDEDILVEALFQGLGDHTRRVTVAA
jgi:hypothetical protein